MKENGESEQVKPKYIPTVEELKGESWEHCYGPQSVTGPPLDDDSSIGRAIGSATAKR